MPQTSLILPLGGRLSTGEPPEPALDIPAAYNGAPRHATAALPKRNWWRSFHSRELTRIVGQARAANLDIAAAIARIEQADAQARIAGAALLPVVDLGGSATHLRSSQSTSVGGTSGSFGGSERDLLSTSLTASYEIDFWGKNRAALRTAEEGAIAISLYQALGGGWLPKPAEADHAR